MQGDWLKIASIQAHPMVPALTPPLKYLQNASPMRSEELISERARLRAASCTGRCGAPIVARVTPDEWRR